MSAEGYEIGVGIVPSFPHLYAIVVPILLATVAGLLLLGKGFVNSNLAHGIIGGVLAVVMGTTLVLFYVRNIERIQLIHDYPATFAALEARYGVTLSDENTSGVTFPGPGKYATVNQTELGPVTRTDGTVIDDVYVQYSTGSNQRAALVLPGDDTNTLLVTTGTWWDELPVEASPAAR